MAAARGRCVNTTAARVQFGCRDEISRQRSPPPVFPIEKGHQHRSRDGDSDIEQQPNRVRRFTCLCLLDRAQRASSTLLLRSPSCL